MSSKNLNPSLLDQHQMQNLMFDETNHAQRVIIVGDSRNLVQAPEAAQTVSVQTVVQKEYITVPQIERIEVPVIIKETEIREVQVPVIQEKIQVVHVDKIITLHDTKIVEIEKPVVVTQVEYRDNVSKDLLKVVYGLVAIQAVSILVQIAFHFIK